MVKKLRIHRYYNGGAMLNTFSTNVMAAPFMGMGQGMQVYNPSQGVSAMPTINAYAKAGDITAMMLKNNSDTNSAIKNMQDFINPENLIKTAIDGYKSSNTADKIADDIDKIKTRVAGNGLEDAAKESLGEKPKFMDTKLGKGLGMAGSAVASFYDVIPSADKVINSKDEFTQNLRGQANKALLSGAAGPWGMAAGALNTIIDKTGGFTDASEGLGGGTDFANQVASLAIPGAGWFTKRTETYKKSDALASSSSYTGTSADGDKAMKNAGAKILFGRGKANEMIRKQKERDNQVQGILRDAKDDFAGAASSNFISSRNMMDSMGGYQALRVKHGGVIRNMEFVRKCKRKRKMQNGGSVEPTAMPLDFVERMEVANGTKGNVDDMTKKVNKKKEEKPKANPLGQQQPPTGAFYMKRGGKINVIPSGKLHKERHRLEKIIEGMDKVSTKGIPIVVANSIGELKQQAEIERDEIILNKDLSNKLLKLMESDDEDAAMIEAGKLLADEIMDNTEDNTGLIKSVKV